MKNDATFLEKDSFSEMSYELSQEQIASFRDQGFVLLKGLFPKDVIHQINEMVQNHLAEPTDKYQTGFKRVKYDIFEDEPQFNKLQANKSFRSVIHQLCGRDMLHTQTLAFEMKQKTSTGFPWHIGTQSFGFQRAEDFGCTLWVPMVEIDNSKQKGGMAYVPTNIISGAFMYEDIDPASFALVEDYISSNKEITIEEFIELRDGPLNHAAMKRLLDYYAVADDFEVGDALLFDKYVIHKSVLLEEGPIEARAALAMRFIASDSRYDKKRAENLEIPRKFFSYSGPTRFHLEVGEEDGQLLVEGPLYRDQPHRVISAE